MLGGESILAIAAILVSVLAAGFTGCLAWTSARQVKLQKAAEAIHQGAAKLQEDVAAAEKAAAELSFNLQVMTRLDTVLMAIADRPEAYAHVWDAAPPQKPPQDNRIGHVLTQSLTDVLELALQAAARLPGFAVNADDWNSYADFVFEHSAAVRIEVGEQPQWWPAVSERLEVFRDRGDQCPPPAPDPQTVPPERLVAD